MIIETIFYFLGSLFFLISLVILGVFLYFSIKIMRQAVSIVSEIENAVTEAKNAVSEARGAVSELKNKVSAFSLGIAGIVSLLEKLIDFKNRSRAKDGAPQKQKKEKKEKKFAQEAEL